MELFIPLTPFQTKTAERGKASGNQVTTRFVLAADNWNWAFGYQKANESGDLVGQSFFGSMRQMLFFLSKIDGLSIQTVVANVVKEFENRTGKVGPVVNDHSLLNLDQLGQNIDLIFGTSYFIFDGTGTGRKPMVLERIFKVSKDGDKAVTTPVPERTSLVVSEKPVKRGRGRPRKVTA